MFPGQHIFKTFLVCDKSCKKFGTLDGSWGWKKAAGWLPAPGWAGPLPGGGVGSALRKALDLIPMPDRFTVKLFHPWEEVIVLGRG